MGSRGFSTGSALCFCVSVLFTAVGCGGPSARSALAALAENDLERAREIYAAGVDPDELVTGQTGLTMSACHASGEIVDVLLEAGADPDLPNRRRLTPLILAARCGNLPVVRRLLEGDADPNLASPGGTTALSAAREAAHEEIVLALLQAGAAEDQADAAGRRKATGY